jgi:hypothetical protein
MKKMTTEKINLREITNQALIKVEEAIQREIVEFVEQTAIPTLIERAEGGYSTASLTVPDGLVDRSNSIAHEITKRVRCNIAGGGRPNKVTVHW